MMLRVSDHAALRYCERMLGFDSGTLETSMRKLIGDAQEGRFKLPNAPLIAVVKNGVVVTFAPDKLSQPRPKKPKKLRPLRPEPDELAEVRS